MRSRGRSVPIVSRAAMHLEANLTYTGATEVMGPGSVGRVGNGVSGH